MEKSARETVDDILLGCVNERLPLPTSSNAGFMKKTQAIAEIWAGVEKAWAANYNVTVRQLGPYNVRRLNAQRYARQVLRAKEFMQTQPHGTHQAATHRLLRQKLMEH